MAEQEALQAEELIAEEPPQKYYIDTGWFERQGRSFEFMIESRVEGLDVPSSKGSRKRGKAASKGTSLEDISKIEGFVKPELPILEAVFRLLLIHQNKPMDVDQISQELAELGLGVLDARMITPQTLIRTIDKDFHYGLTRDGS